VAERLMRSLFDDPFAGIHKLSWFELVSAAALFRRAHRSSVYGLHRYDVIRTYFKYRKNATPPPNRHFDELPPVTIQLPIYNERYVIERLIDESDQSRVSQASLQIQVLDDSTDDTHPYAEALVERYRALGFPIEYLHRSNREGFKAGALQEGLKTATASL